CDKFLGERDAKGRFQYNLALGGRAKKNFKTFDLVLAALYALLANDSMWDNQVYVLANDEDQAGDDLALAKKLVAANSRLAEKLIVHKNVIKRVDNRGFMEILHAGDAAGAHG